MIYDLGEGKDVFLMGKIDETFAMQLWCWSCVGYQPRFQKVLRNWINHEHCVKEKHLVDETTQSASFKHVAKRWTYIPRRAVHKTNSVFKFCSRNFFLFSHDLVHHIARWCASWFSAPMLTLVWSRSTKIPLSTCLKTHTLYNLQGSITYIA